MSELFRLPTAVQRDPSIDAWFSSPGDALRWIAQPWFNQLRRCGPDVHELLHDGHPTACVGDAAFGYVDAFRTHVNVGFFHGAALEDPSSLLEGAGKRMRHVKIHWGREVDAAALSDLIVAAYHDIRLRLSLELPGQKELRI